MEMDKHNRKKKTVERFLNKPVPYPVFKRIGSSIVAEPLFRKLYGTYIA